MAANTLTDGRAMTAQEVSRIAAAPAGQYGALSTVGGAVTVSAGMTLNVAAVAANTVTINGTVVATAYAGSTVTISASDPTNPRRDAITYDSAGAVAVTAGTPAAVTATTGPVLPTITASQYLLAEVYVGAGVTSITSGNIVDRRQVAALFGVSGATLTAAATLPITNQVHHVTGGTTITALPTWPSGAMVSVTFDGATPITHNSTSLILLGGINYTTNAGDVLMFVSEGSGNWREISRQGARLVAGGTAVNELAALTGDPVFPYYGNVATTRTDAASATITDSTYAGKIIELATWTINANQVMTMQGGPWFIFVNTLAFGNTTSQISGDGPTATTTISSQYARGGVIHNTNAAAGCGGVMIFVCAGSITTAAGKITANGGAGVSTTTATSDNGQQGQGALSTYQVASGSSAGASNFDGSVAVNTTGATTGYSYAISPYMLLGFGGAQTARGNPPSLSSSVPATGGGNGGISATAGGTAGGGSGIGSGGGANTGAGAGVAATLPLNTPTIKSLLALAFIGCLGGGGGGVSTNITAANYNAAAGGGGGSVVVFARTLSATPTLSVSAGTGQASGANARVQAASAGVSYLVTVP